MPLGAPSGTEEKMRLKFLSSRLVIAEDAFEIADPAVVQALRPFVDRLATHMGEATTVRLAPEGLAAWSDQQQVLQGREA